MYTHKKKYIWKLYLCKSKIVQKKNEYKNNKEKSIDRSRPALEQPLHHSISNYSTISSPVFRLLSHPQIYLFHLAIPFTGNKLKLEYINLAENHQSREEYVYMYKRTQYHSKVAHVANWFLTNFIANFLSSNVSQLPETKLLSKKPLLCTNDTLFPNSIPPPIPLTPLSTKIYIYWNTFL